MPDLSASIRLRLAIAEDVSGLRQLIEASVRGLMTAGYSPEQLEGALGTYLGVDTQLIADQTYFVAEAEQDRERVIVGCGGWSRRKTLFGADRRPGREDTLLDPAEDAAKIRAFFVHPKWARCGIGSRILDACENAARDAGFTRFEMGATLTGVPLYEARGYTAIDSVEVSLANGEVLKVVKMAKAASR